MYTQTFFFCFFCALYYIFPYVELFILLSYIWEIIYYDNMCTSHTVYKSYEKIYTWSLFKILIRNKIWNSCGNINENHQYIWQNRSWSIDSFQGSDIYSKYMTSYRTEKFQINSHTVYISTGILQCVCSVYVIILLL